jgi:hypothetical protein
MDHSPAYIIAQYLIGQSLLSDPTGSGSWPVYVGTLPDGNQAQDDAAGCMDTSPVKDGRIMSNGETIFHPGVQILLRALAYNTGYAKCEALMTALEAVSGAQETINSKTYQIDNVSPSTGIVVLGQEAQEVNSSKRRELYSMNFIVTLKEI